MEGPKRLSSGRWKALVPGTTDISPGPAGPESRVSSGRWKAPVPTNPDGSPASATTPESSLSSGRWKAVVPGITDISPTPAASSEAKLKPGTAGRIRIINGEAPVEPTVVAITSRSHDDVLEHTHAFVATYARRRFRATLAVPLSVAAYELLGNALNYGSVVGDVEFQIIETPKSVAVRVSSESVPVRVDMLRAHLERVNKDPEGMFLEEMRRSLAGGGARPMLGLARVVHEAKLALEVYIASNRVTVIARAPL